MVCAVTLLILGLLAEGAALWALFVLKAPEMQFAAYSLLHLLSALLISLFIYRFLPLRYQAQRFRTLAFLTTLQFAIPLIGSVGALAAILPAVYLTRKHGRQPFEVVEIPELPYRPVSVSAQPLYSQGGLVQVLREAGDVEKRMKALIATRMMPERQRMQLLKEALQDPEDDVRLLAYAMLEEKEAEINGRIMERQEALEKVRPGERPRLQLLLAQDYWELVFLGIATGGLRRYYLQQCGQALEAVLEMRQDAQALRLLGRVRLAQNRPEEAARLFEAAMDAGMPAEQLLPYVAEAAFLQRRFEQVAAALRRYRERVSQPHPTLLPVVRWWTEAGT